MTNYSSDSDDYTPTSKRFFGPERPFHAILGGGKAADILLWRNPKLSAAIVMGCTAIWSLFQVGEYNFVTLISHISITTMLILFLWSSGAALIHRNPPDLTESITISESTVHWLFAEINKLLFKFYHISSGKDLKTFFLAIAFLWILSVIGNYFTSLNMLYIGFVGLMSIPALYERYEEEVNYLANKWNRDVKRLYRKIENNFLNKIPRG
ncbi:reticulon-like protein [Striga asiatica]|uniref:Reticulon-like protein n=1 Tax=Striga asiatica TaxID=4170 RepID=A0A5A7QEY9_STRAF|nr:reticulon-like protein [Striga asiatica]